MFSRIQGALRKLSESRRYLQLKPFDTSTEEGRSNERYRRAALTTASSLVARTLTASVSLLQVPLTIGYLGKERYGMWAAINALLTWGALADLGLRGGLLNHLSEAYGKDDKAEAARLVSTAFFSLLALAVGFGALFIPTIFLVPWGGLLNLPSPELLAEAPPAALAVLLVFLANFPLSVVGQIYFAHQRGYVAYVFTAIGCVLSLITLLIVIEAEGGLPWLIFASGGVGLCLTFVNMFYIFGDLPHLWPQLRRFSRASLDKLVKLSIALFCFQIGALLINEVQIFILAHAQGVDQVTDYTVFLKVFSVPVFLTVMIDGPLIPAFREAYARGDRKWLRSAFWRVQRIKLAMTVGGSVAMLLAGNLLAGLLSRSTVQFDTSVWAAGGVLLIVGCWNGSYTNLFIAVDRVWILVATVVANGLVTAPLTYFFAKSYGMTGVVIATVAFSLVVTAWLMPVLARPILRDGGEPGDLSEPDGSEPFGSDGNPPAP